jgi:hypothetical protein
MLKENFLFISAGLAKQLRYACRRRHEGPVSSDVDVVQQQFELQRDTAGTSSRREESAPRQFMAVRRAWGFWIMLRREGMRSTRATASSRSPLVVAGERWQK